MGGAQVVMGEDEVAAAGLDVEGQVKALLGDGDALHVPAGAAPAEGAAVPGRLPLALGAPQQRVEAAPLALAVGVPAPVGEDLEHLLLGPAGDVSEGAVEGEVVVPVVALGIGGRHLVGAAPLAQGVDGGDDLVHRLAHGAVGLRRDDAQRRHVLAEQRDLGLGELAPVDAVAVGALQQRVVDVGDVLGGGDPESGVHERTTHEVGRVIGRRMAQVGRVVRGDPADVEAGVSRHERRHGGDAPGAGVEQPQRRRGGGQRGQLRGGPGLHHSIIRSTPSRWDQAPPSGSITPNQSRPSRATPATMR